MIMESSKFTRDEMLEILKVVDSGPDSVYFSEVSSLRVKDFLVREWGLVGEDFDPDSEEDSKVHDSSKALIVDGRDMMFCGGYERTRYAVEWMYGHEEHGWSDSEIDALAGYGEEGEEGSEEGEE
jgi:hypothetical protein